eukprot:NODE_326_length_2451_cov_45.653622_g281_i1.p1 GENE.NODE_326_length_2451_cov_45.653622_g281_i1~~NODE_326_length_2451_cov_45.653622_g281_i1.p1  ORF type:complete len:672 (-),score=130.57 NODE_326_length_2451_cov_45.653622_g281_i1:175-2190(-)
MTSPSMRGGRSFCSVRAKLAKTANEGWLSLVMDGFRTELITLVTEVEKRIQEHLFAECNVSQLERVKREEESHRLERVWETERKQLLEENRILRSSLDELREQLSSLRVGNVTLAPDTTDGGAMPSPASSHASEQSTDQQNQLIEALESNAIETEPDDDTSSSSDSSSQEDAEATAQVASARATSGADAGADGTIAEFDSFSSKELAPDACDLPAAPHRVQRLDSFRFAPSTQLAVEVSSSSSNAEHGRPSTESPVIGVSPSIIASGLPSRGKAPPQLEAGLLNTTEWSTSVTPAQLTPSAGSQRLGSSLPATPPASSSTTPSGVSSAVWSWLSTPQFTPSNLTSSPTSGGSDDGLWTRPSRSTRARGRYTHRRSSCTQAEARLVVVGGWDGTGRSAATEVFDAVEEVWTALPAMPTPRHALAVGEVDNVLYAVGGGGGAEEVAVTEAFDALGKSWQALSPLPTPRAALAVGVLAGCLVAVGGFRNGNSCSTVELYHPDRDRWVTAASLLTPRRYPAVGVVRGKLVCVGGCDGTQHLRSAEMYDAEVDKWTELPPMSTARNAPAAAVLEGRLFLMGGSDGGAFLSSAEAFDAASGKWHSVSPMAACRRSPAAGTIGPRVYVVGGHDGVSTLASGEAYNPILNSWLPIPDMPTARYGLAAGVIAQRVYQAWS